MVRFKVALFALFGLLVLQFPAEAGVVYFTEPFANNDAGWTLDSTWQIGSAASSSGNNFGNPDPAADHTATADNGIAGVEIGGNAPVTLPDPEHGYYYLTSPVVNTVGAPGLYLDFYRWLNSDYTPYMQNQVQVYDGANWQTIWESDGFPGVQDAAWTQQTFDISPYANADLQVRFGYQIGDPGVDSVSSWNLDDVSIYSPGATVPEPATLSLVGSALLAAYLLRPRARSSKV